MFEIERDNYNKFLVKAQSVNNFKWVLGFYVNIKNIDYIIDYEGAQTEIIPDTVCRYTGIRDINEKPIFENDIIIHKDEADTISDLYAIVKLSKYKQDGSSGEYSPTLCYGWFLHHYKFENIPDYDDGDWLSDDYKDESIVDKYKNYHMEVHGNIFDK